ncbi:hypothetical protein [Heyndrickxia sporothermodurans]|uniref:Uncharacterized protein n=1 Tax=Heyndrickxia sporothermodurans TaxID=46224 RepID=A0AB37HQD8_9BACI|nr:hypothetical protein [Heyndrickxia sporothermodurans]MBL5769082.1 hypothetical protein [Heyndrickxia sporothermodurans]MBL5772863.1 hypothetical protein [Heyndrickxia sporothermodurans]MBL5776323.1 hypothetical protein [Heyndrickxia sporothermodurans]MBL5782437.1 hypothetical protein [Heyndrickxia sporothermodurans]MBL5786963.1 hypothetical protein [Heyndrickxia sporothermodurans]
MDNIDDLISEAKLTHREVSNRAGNSNNWFNDAYNNNEDIHISSFVKVLSVIDNKQDLKEHKLLNVFDKKILSISTLISRLSDEDEQYINDFIISDKQLFLDVLGDWASMEYKNKLNEKEKEIMEKVKILISKI